MRILNVVLACTTLSIFQRDQSVTLGRDVTVPPRYHAAGMATVNRDAALLLQHRRSLVAVHRLRRTDGRAVRASRFRNRTLLDQHVRCVATHKYPAVALHLVISNHDQPVQGPRIRQVVCELHAAIPHANIIRLDAAAVRLQTIRDVIEQMIAFDHPCAFNLHPQIRAVIVIRLRETPTEDAGGPLKCVPRDNHVLCIPVELERADVRVPSRPPPLYFRKARLTNV